ncbi:hypothetical protein SAY86_019053 [Trapa natans]|uniref:Non-haem dioxygenase N-terminal domain-containing protein n=1 Tax=Trapa natans TaxID=22666 RepID=A0AAN7R1I8_TRANT|nr:hypothetical protein SAY86_019053 [Trapa natans]
MHPKELRQSPKKLPSPSSLFTSVVIGTFIAQQHGHQSHILLCSLLITREIRVRAPRLSEVSTCDRVPVIDLGCQDRAHSVEQIRYACTSYGIFQVLSP